MVQRLRLVQKIELVLLDNELNPRTDSEFFERVHVKQHVNPTPVGAKGV